MTYKNFFYSFPTKYVFGDNSLKQLPNLLQEWGAERVVVFHGSTAEKLGICQEIEHILQSLGCTSTWIGDCPQNPDTDFLDKKKSEVEEFAPNFFLAAGGGSVIDAAKGMADRIGCYTIPIGTIPTLPASGSESNRSFIIKDKALNKKVGKADLRLVPKFAICDPAYTRTLSQYQVNCALADIMAHLLEQFFCLEDIGLIDRLILACIEQLVEIESSLAKNFYDKSARQELTVLASFSLSYVLSCGRTLDWIPHTLEHCLSGIYDSNHGEGLSILMPQWIRFSAKNPHYEKRLALLGQKYSANHNNVDEGVEFINTFFHRLGLAPSIEKMIGGPADINMISRLATDDGAIGRVNPIDYSECLKLLNDTSL